MRILAVIGQTLALLKLANMMTTQEKTLPLCARIFRWAFFISLSGISITAFVLFVGFVVACFAKWGLLWV